MVRRLDGACGWWDSGWCELVDGTRGDGKFFGSILNGLDVSAEEDAQLGPFPVGLLRYLDQGSVAEEEIDEVVEGDGEGAAHGLELATVDGDGVGGNEDLELFAGLLPAGGQGLEAGMDADTGAVVVVEGEALGFGGGRDEVAASGAGVDGVVLDVEEAAGDDVGVDGAGVAVDAGEGDGTVGVGADGGEDAVDVIAGGGFAGSHSGGLVAAVGGKDVDAQRIFGWVGVAGAEGSGG